MSHIHHECELERHIVEQLAADSGGNIEAGSVMRLPDGSGCATIVYPLPKNHWLTADGYDEPPMPMRIGTGGERDRLADKIRSAAKYAIRVSTMNGKEIDFDPDAMVQNFIVGLLGYWTNDGFSHVDDES